MGYVKAKRKKNLSTFRKIAIGSWEPAYDAQVYGSMKLKMDETVRYIEKFREVTGKKITVTHMAVKAMGLALKACPDANAYLRFNQLYVRETIDIGVLVASEEKGGYDLSLAKLKNVDELSLLEMIEKLDYHLNKIRVTKTGSLEKTRQVMTYIPSFCINFVLKLIAFFAYTLNLDLSKLGMPKDLYGGAIISSIGSLGLDIAYPPLFYNSRVPIILAPGSINDEPIVENGEITIGKRIHVSATFDHRIIDGAHASVLAKTFREVIENPFEHLDPLD